MIDIIIPTFNNYHELKACLNALAHQTIQNFEVWIAVDGSTDETLTQLPNLINSLPYPAHILEHHNKQNHGRAATRNLALPHIKKTYLWFLDSDMLPEPTCLEAHLNLCTQYPNAISVGAILYQNTHHNLWAKYIATRGHAKFSHQKILPWNYFITANSMIPSYYFLQLKGFDQNIKQYGGEDMELAYRILLKYKANFYKNDLALCKTTQNKTLSQALIQLEEYGREGLPYIYQKHPNMPKVYLLHKLQENTLQKTIYQFLTLPLWTQFIKPCIKFLPFTISQLLINYLIITTIHKGYKDHLKQQRKKQTNPPKT